MAATQDLEKNESKDKPSISLTAYKPFFRYVSLTQNHRINPLAFRRAKTLWNTISLVPIKNNGFCRMKVYLWAYATNKAFD